MSVNLWLGYYVVDIYDWSLFPRHTCGYLFYMDTADLAYRLEIQDVTFTHALFKCTIRIVSILTPF